MSDMQAATWSGLVSPRAVVYFRSMHTATRISSALGFWVLTSITPGCAVHASETQLTSMAARDFSCPGDNLRQRTLDERTRWVAGCGKSATYQEQCRRNRDGKDECNWERREDDADDSGSKDDKKARGKDDE
jgi:hypothetical protein